MEKQYELISRLYQITSNQSSLFSNLELWIELFAEKQLCAYNPQTGEVTLIRKEQRKFDQLIKQILKPLNPKDLETTSTIKPMEILTQTLEHLEKLLIEQFPENSPIEFGSFGLEGLLPITEMHSVQQKHSDLIVQNVKEMFDELLEEDFDFPDWRN